MSTRSESPLPAAGPAITTPTPTATSRPAEFQKVELPSAVDSVIRAGRGDLLLLRMGKLAKLAVFDIKAGKIAGYIPLGGNDTLVAGTADSIILVARDKKVAQRWSCDNLEKKLTVTLPIAEELNSLAAGYDSTAPILIMTGNGPHLIDPVTLDAFVTYSSEDPTKWNLIPDYPIQVAASADGTTFAGWAPHVSPSGIRILRVEGHLISGKYEHQSVGRQTPSADGALLFTDAGVYNADLKPLDRGNRGVRMCTFPTLNPGYYVGVASGGLKTDQPAPTVGIYTTADRTLLLTLDELPGFSKNQEPDRNSDQLPISDRIIVHPAAKKMIIVDSERTYLHIVPLDIVKALDDKGIDYLFVESLPITKAVPGGKYEYPIKVVSKAEKLKFTLETGPEGMTITRNGVLRWKVPRSFAIGKVDVTVTIENAAKQSALHSFSITASIGEAVLTPSSSSTQKAGPF
jgi:hypothetical protein